MFKRFQRAFAVGLVLMFVSLGQAEDKPVDVFEVRAREFLQAMARDDLAGATKDFDEAMTKALPGDKILGIWRSLVTAAGPFKKQGAAKASQTKEYRIFVIRCEFEKKSYDARVVLNLEKKISGLFVANVADYKLPAYVKKDLFKDTELTIGSEEWPLGATISMPLGEGPFPGVVLVHGSGPQDRDETIGPNKPFRDLAWGLASQGVAVLRYEKRTRAHGLKLAKIKELTTKEEVLDDALEAVKVLRKTPGIDPKQVFVIGHSLGAMAAPKLGELDPNIKGLILMAGPSRPIEEVLIEQLRYVTSLEKITSPEDQEKVDKLLKDANRLADPKLSPEDFKEGKLLGASFAYWKSVHHLEPAATAAKLNLPLFVLQGGRDYQVTLADFELWTKILKDKKSTLLKDYPSLNHVFMEGVGKAKPEEYEKEGHVASVVIDDIVTWIKKTSRGSF